MTYDDLPELPADFVVPDALPTSGLDAGVLDSGGLASDGHAPGALDSSALDLDALVSGALAEPDLALLLTPVAVPEQLAAICALVEIRAEVFDTPTGAVAALTELAGGAPERSAKALTEPLPGLEVILLQRTAGQLSSATFASGKPRPDATPVIYALLPEPLEGLLLGTTTPAEIPGLLPSTGVGKRAAAKWLAQAARKTAP